MNKPLTVVLPVRNAESTLRRHVAEVLEIAGELTSTFRLYIVDDCSTDDTFDTAMELSKRYPQIKVMRNTAGRALGSALETIRPLVAGHFVLVHDGASPIDAKQVRRMWMEEERTRPVEISAPATIDDLRRAAAGHAAMAAAHARLAGFQRMVSGPTPATSSSNLERRDARRTRDVGVIPPLPRPNFMGALANFALGE